MALMALPVKKKRLTISRLNARKRISAIRLSDSARVITPLRKSLVIVSASLMRQLWPMSGQSTALRHFALAAACFLCVSSDDPSKLTRLGVRCLPNVRKQFVVVGSGAPAEDKLRLADWLVVHSPKFPVAKPDNNVAALYLDDQGRRSLDIVLSRQGQYASVGRSAGVHVR